MKLVTRFIFTLLFSVTLLSQRYLVHQYDEIQGLTTTNVNDVVQDYHGQLWLATRSGVAVYDGFSWRNHTVRQGTQGANFLRIIVDPEDRVWVLAVSYDNRLEIFRFNGKDWHKFVSPPVQKEQNVEFTSFAALRSEEQTRLAVGIGGLGLFCCGENEKDWVQFTEKNGLIGNHVNGLAVWSNRLYVATEKGLSMVYGGRVDNSLNRRLGLHPGPVRAIGIESAQRFNRTNGKDGSPLKDCRIWLHGPGWLGYFSPENENLHEFSLPTLFPYPKICRCLLPDYREGVFLASQTRIYYFNIHNRQIEPFNIKSGLIVEGANSLYIDDESNIWIACQRGLSKIASRRFGSYQMQHGLLEDEVTAILEYKPGKLVFGHPSGLTFYDSLTFSPLPIDMGETCVAEVSRILDIKTDSKQNIWLAVAQQGLCRIDQNRRIKWFGKEQAKRGFINGLWVREDDSLWVATGKGLLTLRDERLVPLDIARDIRTKIRKIFISSNGTLYLGTMAEGIYEYREDRWHNYRIDDFTPANSVFTICEDRRGSILIGCRGGLYTLVNGGLEKYAADKLRLDRPVFFILEDNEGHLWLGTDRGLVHWDGTMQLNYDRRNGLIGPETNRAAAIVDSHGVPWFGTNRGVSFYNKELDDLPSDSAPPKVRLLYLEAGDKKISLDFDRSSAIYLKSKHSDLTFHFQGISLMDERAIRFRHKLAGFDTRWSDEHFPYKQVIRYRNLPPGTYRFFLKARNGMGIWSPEVRSGIIVVGKPLYQRWWFYLIVIGILIVTGMGIQRHVTIRYRSTVLERHVAERTDLLKAAEERYSRLFMDSKDAVLIISPDGRFFDLNPAGLELFGYSSKANIFMASLFNNHFRDSREIEIFRQKVEEKGFVKDYELVLKKNNGERFTALVTANLVKNKQGQMVAYQGIIRDNTERKRLEQQLEQTRKMKAIGALAGGVAHDLNNILSGLINYPEILLMDISRESSLGKTILAIKRTGEKAAAIVQDLLTLSRGASGVHEVLNLNDVLGEYMMSPENERLRNAHPQVHFEIRLSPDLLNIMGSPIHLFKSVMNLVTNAAEAIQGEGVCTLVTENIKLLKPVRGHEDIERGEFALLTVKDNGVGISEENINRIFEPFYTTKIMGRSGTGLGMSVVWGTVKDHHGFIDVESKLGSGTQFKLYFPVTRERIKTEQKLPSVDRFRGTERILVVDDVVEQREIATAILKRLGYHVTALPNGERAVEYLKKESTDLVLLDMIMNPGMDGLETFQEILKIYPRQKAVIVSGHSKSSRITEALRLGAGTFVQKPYTIDKIGGAIREELDKPMPKFL